MQRLALSLILVMLVSVPAGAHTLWGDFKVLNGGARWDLPTAFELALLGQEGRIVQREIIRSGGRYQFQDVSNGNYAIIVFMEGIEVGRIDVRIGEIVSSIDVQQDVTLEYREFPQPRPEESARTEDDLTASVADYYLDRTEINQERFDAGREAVEKGDFDRAIRLLEESAVSDEKDFEAWAELATTYARANRTGDAIEAFETALDLRPAFGLALTNFGNVLLSERRYDDAIRILTRAVEARPGASEAYYLLGEAYLQAQLGSRAVAPMREAIRLDPDRWAEAHLRLGALYRAAGLVDEAVREFEQFLEKRPDHEAADEIRDYISAQRD